MKILLQSNHLHLPFSCSPKQPKTVFDPEVMHNWQMEAGRCMRVNDIFPSKSIGRTWIWPILIGIHNLELPLLAHVSVGFNEGLVTLGNKLWVQFTTIPEENDKNGIPLLFDSGRNKKVELLWAPKVSINSPWEFPGVENVDFKTKMSEDFWKSYFMRLLKEEKNRRIDLAKMQLKEAESAMRLYSLI